MDRGEDFEHARMIAALAAVIKATNGLAQSGDPSTPTPTALPLYHGTSAIRVEAVCIRNDLVGRTCRRCGTRRPLRRPQARPLLHLSRRHIAMTSDSPRTLGEAVMDVRYCARYHELNERFHRRLDTFLTLVAVAGGASAIVGLGEAVPDGWAPHLARWGGALLAIFAVLQILVKPGEQATRHAVARRALLELESVAWDLDLRELDRRKLRIDAESPQGLRSLEWVAFNANLRTHGFADRVVPVPWVSQVLDWVL